MKSTKIFISCGQSTQEEKQIGIQLSNYFRGRGFEPYFAEEIHTPEGITNNVFNTLKESEYFICILTPRMGSETGSLFVQQELAIASFLQIPTLLFHFQEIQLEGIAKYLILNPIQVTTVDELLQSARNQTETWNNTSKNQLFLSFENHHRNLTIANAPNQLLSDWYHITVYNPSRRFHAKDCIAYIASIIDVSSGQYIICNDDYKIELIWAGTGDVTVNIPSGGKRDFDAFYTIHRHNHIIFQQRTMSAVYQYKNLPFGHYKIVYVILADNFPSSSIEIEIEYGQNGVSIVSSEQIE